MIKVSSFICSKEHFKKVRDLTYYLIKCNRHYVYWENVKIPNDSDDSILNYVNNNIYELIKLSFASVNYQYNEEGKITEEYYKMLEEKPTEKFCYNDYTLTANDLIGLYNAYKCINYQIELNYNTNFINNIKILISDSLMYKLKDYSAFEEANDWEYN